MLTRHAPRSIRLTAIASSILFTVALLTALASRISVRAAPILGTRFDRMSTSVASDNGTHLLGITFNNLTDPLGSIVFEFCSNDPIPHTTCDAPSGFDLTGVSLADQSGEIGFSIHPNSTANTLILTRSAGMVVVPGSLYQLNNVINPDTPGSYYIRILTYSSEDGTGPNLEEGGIAFSISRQLNINAEVPPFLKFCASVTIVGFDCTTATSFLIDLGEFRTDQVSQASSEFVVATNGGSGYSISVAGTTLTAGNNTIPALSGGSSSPGTSQFGLNLRANTSPAIGADLTGPGLGTVQSGYDTVNQFRFQNGDTLVTAPGASDDKKFTVSYITNISSAQPAGFYATTMTYIALANF